MGTRTASGLDAAFSLLPKEKAREALESVLRDHAQRGAFALDLKWSEHDVDGTFLRGGVTDLVSRTTRLIAHSQVDPDIQELARRAFLEIPLAGALALLPTGDRFAWFLPFTPTQRDRKVENRVRGLMVSQVLFSEMLDLMQPDRGFTESERRVMFQVIAGLSLRDAARADGVGYETKRAQIKSVFSKMHCANQQELVRIMLGQLVHLLSVSEAESAHSGTAEAFVGRHLAEDVQISARRLRNGRVIRLLTCGPEGGQPLVVIHGMMFPISLAGISRHLDVANLRLTIPIRAGFLEERSPADLVAQKSFIEEAFADIALWMEEEALGPAPMLGQSLGGALAIRFANLYPNHVSKLILQSVNLPGRQEKDDSAGRFYEGLKVLSNDPDVFRRVNWQYYKYYSNRDTSRTILSRLFADLPIDMAVLDGGVTGTEAYAMFADLYASSVFGMSGDFDFVMNGWEAEMRNLDKPIVFIHGEDDPLTNPAQFASIIKSRQGLRQHIIPDAGHFAAASHASEVWKTVALELTREG